MKFNSIIFGITAAFLLNSPAIGGIKLTNGDFSNGSNGWSDLTGYGPSTLYDITGGVATAPGNGSNRSLYQKVSSSLETAATVIFDVTVNTLGSGGPALDLEFHLISGAAGSFKNTVALGTNKVHQFVLYGGEVKIFTSEFALTAGTTYTISLYMSGMDGAGGQMGKVSGSILDQTTMVANRFSVSHANIAPFDGVAFCRKGNWGANHQNAIDNVTVVRAPSSDF